MKKFVFDRELQYVLLAVQGTDVSFMDRPSFHHPHFPPRIHVHTEHCYTYKKIQNSIWIEVVKKWKF